MDIIKAIRSIPEWHDLLKLPAKIAELEKRIEALEHKDTSFGICPKCKKSTYKLISSAPHPVFGAVGVKLHTYKCTLCNFSEEILYDPSS